MSEKNRAKDILGNVISSACRQLKIDEGQFEILLGGRTRGGEGLIDWYVNVRPTDGNSDVRINSRRAREVGLIRTRFGITQAGPNGKLRLVIYEWDASKDAEGDYRTVFERDADDPSARLEMSERMRTIIDG